MGLWGLKPPPPADSKIQNCLPPPPSCKILDPPLVYITIYLSKCIVYSLYLLFLSAHGDGLLVTWRGCSLPTIPQLGEDPPLLRTRGYVILRGSRDGSVGSALDCEPMCSSPRGAEHFGSPHVPQLANQRPWYVQPRLCDWAYKRSHATYRKEKGIVSQWSVSS